MARIRADYVFGTTDTALIATDTTLSSASLARLPVVAAPDVATVTLHDSTAGTFEIVYVTDHAASATTATIARAAEGSTAQAWASGASWLHGPTAADLDGYVEAAGVPRLSSGTAEPTAPVVGEMFYDDDATYAYAVAGADVSVDNAAFANIVGTNVQTALDSIDDQLATGGGITVQDENANVATGVTQIDFQGAGVSAGAGTGEVVVTIASSTGSTVAKYKSADESVTSNTLQNDDHLSLTIGANEVWLIQWHLYLSCASATPDIRFAPSAPAGATLRYGLLGAASGNTTTEGSVHVQSHSTGPANPILAGVQANSNSDSYAIFTATIENGGTAGTVNLQWAQNTTDATNAMTVKRGSSMIATRAA